MAYTASKLLEIAIAELGYKEKETNSQLDDKTANAGDGNWTKYARDLHTAGYYQTAKNGYAWCDMFVDWCFLQLGGSKEKGEWLECQTGLYGAGCEWSSNCYRWADRCGTEPRIGAQIFFAKNGKGSEEHTGIVEKFDSNYIYTIEGNASNMVKRKTYNRNSDYILCYGYPRFDETTNETQPTVSEIAADHFSRNDIVTVVNGSNWLTGSSVPSWVIKKEWIVKKVSTVDGEVVIDKSVDGKNSISSPIHYTSLVLVKSASDKVTDDKIDTSKVNTSAADPEYVWKFLKTKGLNDYATAGLMGNLYAESALRSCNLQNSFENSLGMTDAEYTASIDAGVYTNFVNDKAGYGLAQWTYHSRKKKLLQFATDNKKSIGDLDMQLEFLWKELQQYKSVMKQLKSATSVKMASDVILHDFEAPADQSEAVENRRCSFGQKYYDKYAVCLHTNTEIVNQLDATCTLEGYTGDRICKSCMAVVEEGSKICCLEHQYVLTGKVEATATSEGYTGDQICSRCGNKLEGTVIDKLVVVTPEKDEVVITVKKSWIEKFINWLLSLLKN